MRMRRLFMWLLCLFLIAIQPIHSQNTFEKKPVFVENFSTTRLNPKVWGIDIAEFKGHNVYFSDRNYRIRKGVLKITLKKERYKGCDFTSTSIWTKPSGIKFGYGKLEIRAKVPATKECRPALWLNALNSTNQLKGEIDILEHWPDYGKNKYQANFHLWGKIKSTAETHKQYPKVVSTIDVTKWHVYSLEYTPTEITMTVDGKTVSKWAKGSLSDWPQDIQYQLYISLACSTWSTDHVAESKDLPQTLQVDWIKYYNMN